MPADLPDFERIASAVAHESGTTLSVAAAAIRLARHSAEEGSEHAELLDAAARNIRLADLQLLRLRRLDDPEAIDPSRRTTELCQLVRELVRDLKLTALEDRPTDVSCTEPTTVSVDPDLVRLILYNLLANAGRHTDAGTLVVVDVTCRDDRLVIVVRDQGQGVAPELAERIFDRYARDESHGGAGLGLAVSRAAARAHGGDLTLIPREGGGAAFRLTLDVSGDE